ncbi:MAG: Hsp20/alpha crystallin family protein [Chromatiaceae bacterium]
MTKTFNPRSLLAGMTLMAPALALAWAPPYYGYGPLPPGQGGALPDFPAPPSLSSPDRPGFPRAGGPLRFNQTVTAEGYILEIPLDGLKAEDIQVQIDGRALRLSRDTSTQKTREETLGDGQGYLRSFSFSSGRSSHRLPLPADAEVGAMRREDGADQVRIIVPRRPY